MAVGDPYATGDELASYIASTNNQPAIADDHNEAELTAAVNAASRQIDQHCGRVFWDAGSSSARTFRADDWCVLHVPDFHTITSLATDESADGTFETTWSADDYELGPADGVFNGETGWPYRTIVAVESRTFPTAGRRRRVQVDATWGWAAVPATVKQATLILAHRLFERPNTPEGVAGFADFGGVVRLAQRDPDVAALLQPYRADAMLVT